MIDTQTQNADSQQTSCITADITPNPLPVYAKVFKSMFDGTLRGRSDAILVFVNLLVNCDMEGHVDMHPRAIADETGLSVDRVKAALVELESPDPESRTPDMEGRRLVPIDEHRSWGWRIVNYPKYREIRNSMQRREQNRIAKQAQRARANPQCQPPSANVSQPSAMSAHADAEADAEAVPPIPPVELLEASDKHSSMKETALIQKIEDIIAAYPRRSHAAETRQVLRGVLESGTDPKTVLEGVQRIARVVSTWPPWARNRYVPAPPKFFATERWMDDPESWRRDEEPKGNGDGKTILDRDMEAAMRLAERINIDLPD